MKELVKQGHQVKVITGLPDYATSRIPNEYRFFKKRREVIDGAHIIRLPIIARRHGVLFRALNYLSFIVSGYLYACFCSKKDIDSIFVYQTSPVFQAIPAIKIKKRTKSNLTLYCCDLWPESLKAWDIKETSSIFKVVKTISSKIYRACDTVAVTSTPFKEYLNEVCNVNLDKIQYLPQHAEDLYEKIQSKYIENNCVDFMFAGNIGSVQNVDCILGAIPYVKNKQKFHVHIVGDGSELDTCKKLAEQLNITEYTTFHGRKSQEAMKEYYLLADCLLLTLRGGDFIGMTLPAKSQSYLSCGKPVLGAINGAGQELINQSNCGYCVDAGDSEKLAECMDKMIDNFSLCIEKGKNGRSFYEKHFTKDIYIGRLERLLKGIGEFNV